MISSQNDRDSHSKSTVRRLCLSSLVRSTSSSSNSRKRSAESLFTSFLKSNHVILACLLCLSSFRFFTLATTVSKCHHEGDFTVYCNKTKLPSSPDTTEIMRYARVINGLFYNDTLCSYLPNTNCARKLSLSHCVDKPSCTVKNSWFSLEPHCAGNSYYSQLEYDCQPAFYMCGETAYNSFLFSGLVLSPGYPYTYKTEETRTCYLTITLPKNHHAEITLDYFDISKTTKCIGDYLEVQEYRETPGGGADDDIISSPSKPLLKSYSNINNDPRAPNYNYRAPTSSRYNGIEPIGVSSIIQDIGDNSPRVPTRNRQQKARMKASRQQKKPKFKWQTLRTMCGRVNGSLTFRASADVISFKFRSLGLNYPNYPGKNNSSPMGFKIFFQAIPPKAPGYDGDDDLKTSSPKGPSTRPNPQKTQSTKVDLSGEEDGRTKTNVKYGLKLSMWSITAIVGAALLLLAIIVAVLIFVLVKRRNMCNKKTMLTNSKSSLSGGAASGASNTSTNATGKNKPISISNLNKSKTSPTTSSAGPAKKSEPAEPVKPGPSKAAGPPAPGPSTSGVGGGNKVKVIMEAEPRKMQAERPLLLQDLSSSKLLLKYKQAAGGSAESSVAETKKDSPTTAQASTSKQSTPPQSNGSQKQSTPPAGETAQPAKTKLAATSSITSTTPPRQSSSGVYGADIYDGGGVYGAGEPVVAAVPAPAPVAPSAEAQRSSPDSQKSTEKPATTTKKTSSVASSGTATPTKTSRKKSSSTTPPREESSIPKSNGNVQHSKAEPSTADEATDDLLNTTETTSLLKSTNQNEDTQKASEANEPKSTLNSVNDDDNSENVVNLRAKASGASSTANTPASGTSTTPSRKPTAFNPLHVILKDKNKYYTTEYI